MTTVAQPQLSKELAAANKKIVALQAEVEAYDAYCGAVAHELKTPIGNVLAYADDLQANYAVMSTEEIEQHLEMILSQSRRMSSIIDELLLLARVKSSEQLEITQIKMGPLVADVLNQLAAHIQSSNAQIQLSDSWHDAVGYSPWVERIWYNYVTNGLKYGGSPPKLTLGSNLDTDGFVRYWVLDQGAGISPHHQAGLFHPFPEIAKEGPTSNGLGLSIVKQIAERLNGYVGVESEVGVGSTFFFALPSA